jgi:hypothetical protein
VGVKRAKRRPLGDTVLGQHGCHLVAVAVALGAGIETQDLLNPSLHPQRMRLTAPRRWLVLYLHRAVLLASSERQSLDTGRDNAPEGGELLAQRRGPGGRQAIARLSTSGILRQ